MGMTKDGADMIAEAFVGVSFTPGLYLALTYVEPDDEDDGDSLEEPADSAYARQPIYMGPAYWSAANGGVTTYMATVTFPEATEDWESVVYWVLCNAVNGGEVVLWGSFDEAYEIEDAQQVIIPANAFGLAVSAEEDFVMT